MKHKQLVKHIMGVSFFDNVMQSPVKFRQVDCADVEQSRAIGREIAQWMAMGVDYRVHSQTIEIVRK